MKHQTTSGTRGKQKLPSLFAHNIDQHHDILTDLLEILHPKADLDKASLKQYVNPLQVTALERIRKLDRQLAKDFTSRAELQRSQTRQLVSFQANKQRPAYRWYKYKEAFSATLVEALLDACGVNGGSLLGPFSGAVDRTIRIARPISEEI
jgi:hypothetical protein